MANQQRMSVGLVILVLFAAFSFGAIVRIAVADPYHVTCVGHGFVAGASDSDGSFFARVEHGCSSTNRTAEIRQYGSFVGSVSQYDLGSDASAWSRNYSLNLVECASAAHLTNSAAFSPHAHTGGNWCG